LFIRTTAILSTLFQRLCSHPKNLLVWVGVALCGVGIVVGTYFLSLRTGMDYVRQTGLQRLDVYVAAVDNALEKYDYLPKTLELNRQITGLLLSPRDPERIKAVNTYLEQVNQQAKSSVIYILDVNGIAVASSNWNTPTSFMGADLAFRPYVQAALHDSQGRFYAIGTISNEAGYYFARGIYQHGKLLGVATVKVSLEKLEKNWARGVDNVILVDENNIIILSSEPALKYKTLGSLAPQLSARLGQIHQYDNQTLPSLEWQDIQKFDDGTRVVSLRLPVTQSESVLHTQIHTQTVPTALLTAKTQLLAQTRALTQPNWRFILLSDLNKVKRSARATSAFAAVALSFLVVLFLYLRQRHLAVVQSGLAKERLQRAYENLEQMVQERTSALNSTTLELTQEIKDRHQAQLALELTQNELIQSSKMAVLGQMSAGITHELNQPLTALRTMSDNALVLLDRGHTMEVRNNLSVILELIDRMGAITRQLKVFSRKSPSMLIPVSLRRVIENALFLVERRLELEQVHVVVEVESELASGDIFALGDANRIEQVLVNLFINALDSMLNSERRCLMINVATQCEGHEVAAGAKRVFISVRDSGAGIPDDVVPHLFEPFFTTKPHGLGLGLGLVISSQIVGEFGGILTGKNVLTTIMLDNNAIATGALFTVELAAA